MAFKRSVIKILQTPQRIFSACVFLIFYPAPFNQINPMEQQNFFDNMPTGQQDPTYVRPPDGSGMFEPF